MSDFNSLKKDLERRMKRSVEVLKEEFSGLRAGRAHIGLLESVTVEAYGSQMPLNQVGTVGVPDSRTLSVQVWDKSQVKAVEKAIRDADLGLNPLADGQTVRVPIPPLSEERRMELTKVAGKYTEDARIAVRNVRRDGMDTLKKMQKDGEISEDEQRKYESDVQKMTDEAIKQMDEALENKEKDILQV